MKWVAKARSHLRRNIIITIGTLLIIAALVICLVPIMGLTYYEKEPYTATETYWETEPYTETETYIESEPYTAIETYTEREPYTTTVYEPVTYYVTDSGYYNWVYLYYAEAWVTIRNTDTHGGTFVVKFSIYSDGVKYDRTVTNYLYPGSEYKFNVVHYLPIDSCYHTIIPPNKAVEVVKYRQVQKTRSVTKYRDVEKQREVTKYKDVEKTREVIRYRDIAKSRRVTVLEYLLD